MCSSRAYTRFIFALKDSTDIRSHNASGQPPNPPTPKNAHGRAHGLAPPLRLSLSVHLAQRARLRIPPEILPLVGPGEAVDFLLEPVDVPRKVGRLELAAVLALARLRARRNTARALVLTVRCTRSVCHHAQVLTRVC